MLQTSKPRGSTASAGSHPPVTPQPTMVLGMRPPKLVDGLRLSNLWVHRAQVPFRTVKMYCNTSGGARQPASACRPARLATSTQTVQLHRMLRQCTGSMPLAK